MSLILTIVSPEKTLYQGEAEAIIVPGTKGRFEVLPNHAPIISTLQQGQIVYRASGEHTLDIKGGFIEVAHNKVSVCVEV